MGRWFVFGEGGRYAFGTTMRHLVPVSLSAVLDVERFLRGLLRRRRKTSCP